MLHGVHRFPDWVGDAIWAGGTQETTFAQRLFYLLQGEGGCIRMWHEPSPGKGMGFGREEVLQERVVYGRSGVGSRE